MEKIHTNNAPAAIGPYSQAIRSGNLLFISGQIPVDPATGNIDGKNIVEQTERICKNIGEILKASGTEFEKVIKTTCFLADMGDFSAFNGVYEKYFVSKPARNCVAVKALPKNVLAEIETIAEI